MNTAILILDIQRDFVGVEARMPVAKSHIEPMLNTINFVIDKAYQLDLPIIYIGNEFEKIQWIANWFRHNAAIRGNQGSLLDERLRIVNDVYFSKNKGDAFSNPKLVKFLVDKRIDHLAIMGLFAEGCVSSTAKGALRRGFKVNVLNDAVASANDLKREKALGLLCRRGVTIMSSHVFLDIISEESQLTPFIKKNE